MEMRKHTLSMTRNNEHQYMHPYMQTYPSYAYPNDTLQQYNNEEAKMNQMNYM